MRGIVFAASNLGIFAGYVFIALMIVPNIEVQRLVTKIGGFFFFLTCSLTHLELAAHSFATDGLADLLSAHMLAIHGVQFFAVWAFVTGLYIEFVRPHLRPRTFD